MPSEFCRVVEEAAYKAREKREKPQPWILLKLMVPITFAIMVYAAYVFIGRLCVPAIRRSSAVLSRGGGVALVVVFVILWLWMVWAYAMVVFTPPGYARDHVPKCLQPPPSLQSFPANGDVEAGAMANPARNSQLTRSNNSIGGPSYEDLELRAALESNERHEAGILDAPNNALHTLPIPPMPLPTANSTSNKSTKAKDDDLRIKMAMMNVDRRPPITPVLLPEYRYCTREGLIKPYRAHHCRMCGTCVLKFDHHCPWIGQCVGARNHKFFINFNQATSVFTAFTFGTLLAYTIRAQDDLDVQQVVMIALSALFCAFTVSLFVTHARLLCLSETTVESMRDRTIQERESHLMAGALGMCNLPAKRRLRRTWDQEWGRIGKEGNIWWLESGRRGWEDTMGSWWVGWIFPVGRGLSDGLHYTPNPRFDKEGRWRRRREWPRELQ